MAATRSQGHVQFATGDSKSGKYSTLWFFRLEEQWVASFLDVLYQFYVLLPYIICVVHGVRPLFTISRISLADGKKADKKYSVSRRSGTKSKTPVRFIPLF
jgi:hypothetical protein